MAQGQCLPLIPLFFFFFLETASCLSPSIVTSRSMQGCSMAVNGALFQHCNPQFNQSSTVTKRKEIICVTFADTLVCCSLKARWFVSTSAMKASFSIAKHSIALLATTYLVFIISLDGNVFKIVVFHLMSVNDTFVFLSHYLGPIQ